MKYKSFIIGTACFLLVFSLGLIIDAKNFVFAQAVCSESLPFPEIEDVWERVDAYNGDNEIILLAYADHRVCVLTSMRISHLNHNGEEGHCQIHKENNFWWLEAETDNDIDVLCEAMCLCWAPQDDPGYCAVSRYPYTDDGSSSGGSSEPRDPGAPQEPR